MKKVILLCSTLWALALLISSPVQAQNVMFVSPNGSDANSCAQASPCTTFQGAYSKGSVSQINCLASGSYGAITITASLTIDCGTGNVGEIVTNSSGSSSAAITINTSSAATIILRHLALRNVSSTRFGIQDIQDFSSLNLIVEDCAIEQFIQAGIAYLTGSSRGLLQVSNSQIFAGSDAAILVQAAQSSIVSITLNKVELSGISGGGGAGLDLSGGTVAGTMRRSIVSANPNGIIARTGQVFFTVDESSIVANGTGIFVNSAGAVINVGASTIGGNSIGLNAQAGSLISFGNNQMSANGSNGTFTNTVPRL